MKQSFLFTKTQKNIAAEEKSINAQLLIKGAYIDKLMAGVYTLLPLGMRVINKIENIIREEMNAIGGQEIVMPALQPKENWETTGRWSSMDDLYKITDSQGHEMALGPTHEEIVVPLAKKFISSYKDLPVYIYQFQTKFRMELRSKSGILRGREFLMKDFYSFHADEKDLEEYYEKAKQAYFNIFKRCGLGEKTHLTFASGGSFSKYSHEFQTITLAGEDIIYVCEKCGLAINREIKDETEICPDCGAKDFKEEKAIEVGNIFKLLTKYSGPFNLKYTDKEGVEKPVIMGTYGIGLGRLMGTVIEVHHDDKGIIWPMSVAPFQLHLVTLGEAPELAKQAEIVYTSLTKDGFEVLFDDRKESAGVKLNDSDLLGLPIRLVISAKTQEKDSVEVKLRNSDKVELVKINKLEDYINKLIKQ
ncbi:MAG: His/Gly/Thr/Pro-type tRNA ligase C-terminal domain-containing protein [Candidatus Parcubacteria bacterium]|nr:His/Gly/Thr/Pro-type tRNA ligase C-terminal domain-containing protein [Candidatus Parcubacteria bacterium]